jgi:hypothetical protein
MSLGQAKHAAPILVVASLAIAALAYSRIGEAATTAAAKPLRQGGGPIVCYHTDPSDWNCPDSIARTMSINARNVASATIVVRYKTGGADTVQLPAETDAVFLSAKAMRIFLARHYDATNAKKARDVRRFLARHSGTPATR